MNSAAKVVGPLATLILWVWLAYGSFKRRSGRALLTVERWAEQNGVRIERLECRVFRTGPFFLFRSNLQLVFRIAVRDQDKKLRTGWLLVGNWLFGLLVDNVAVCWDRSPTAFSQSPPLPGKSASMWDRDLDAAS